MLRTLHISERLTIPLAELKFEFARSGGPGGQNVNKVSTRVDVLFNVRESLSLTEDQKSMIETVLGSRLDGRGNLRVTAQDSRSQWKNRETGMERLAAMLRRALTPRRKRRVTHPTASSRDEKRRSKQARSRKKAERRMRPDADE